MKISYMEYVTQGTSKVLPTTRTKKGKILLTN